MSFVALTTATTAFPPVVQSQTEARTLSPAQWDACLEQFTEHTVFHNSAWMGVLSDAYGYVPHRFLAVRNGRAQAMVPVLEVSSRLTGRRGVCLPFTDFCAPLLREGSAFRDLWPQMLACGRERRWKYIEIRGGRSSLPEAQVSTAYLGHVIPLSADEAAMFSSLQTEVRTAIRKAERERVHVSFSAEPGALAIFCKLHEQTRRRHGVPPQPSRFFRALQERIISRGMGVVGVATHEGSPVAAAVFLHAARTAVYKFGASDRKAQPIRANNLLFWEAMKRYGKAGKLSLHLGRTSIRQEGLRRFKSGWNAQEERLEYFRYDFRRSEFIVAPEPGPGWRQQVFSRMPLAFSRMIGALLYRHMG